MPLGWAPFAERIDGVYMYTPGGENKVGICSHTAGGYYRTMLDIDFWNISAKCSVHFAISRKGEIAQLVNIFDRAWGQGRLNQPSWPPYPQMNYRNPNEYLISIEHEDAETINGQTVFFGSWTQAQYDASLKVHKWCREEIAYVKGVEMLRFDMDSMAGHYMFDAINRANCPPAKWKNEYRQGIYTSLINQETDMAFHRYAHGFADFNLADLAPYQNRFNILDNLQMPQEAAGQLVKLQVWNLTKTGEVIFYDHEEHGSGNEAGRVYNYGIVEVIAGAQGQVAVLGSDGATQIRVSPLCYWK